MDKKYRAIIAVLGSALALFMIWYFFDILIYIVVAGIISLIGQPLVEQISRLHLRSHYLPKWFGALVTLVLLLAAIAGLVAFFVPLILRQAAVIAAIDIQEVSRFFAGAIRDFQQWLIPYDLFKSDEAIAGYIESQVSYFIGFTDFTKIAFGFLSASGTLMIGLFSVLFLSFFFLRDRHLLRSGILLLTPDKFQKQVQTVLHKTKVMLSRYFIGLVIELLIMMILISIGLSLFGVKNPVLIGFIGGLMNVIPYLGPIIGGTIGVVFGLSSELSLGLYDQLMTTGLEIVFIFAIANAIDNNILQPVIYAKSVYAHPIEIFLVILMAGSLAGIPGMILAIPSYTVLRIVAKEFLSGFKVIDRLTESI